MVSQHDQQKPDNLLVLKKNKTVEANGQRFNNKHNVWPRMWQQRKKCRDNFKEKQQKENVGYMCKTFFNW